MKQKKESRSSLLLSRLAGALLFMAPAFQVAADAVCDNYKCTTTYGPEVGNCMMCITYSSNIRICSASDFAHQDAQTCIEVFTFSSNVGECTLGAEGICS
jgi:hypothetical protein